jgi:hypothetical protein
LKEGSTLVNGELRYYPAVYLLIVNHDRIAIVGSFTSTAEATKEGVDRYRAKADCSGGLIEDR